VTGAISKPAAFPDETAACRFIIDFAFERSGIRLHENKEALIRSRLGKRLRHHGFASLAQYCEFLKTSGDQEEFTILMDALTTNYTNFLRVKEHFRFMVEKALPSLLKPGQKKFNVWSAASSSGEEPYSIAFYLNEFFPPAKGWDWQITASDISTRMVALAREGVYGEEQVRALPSGWLRKYFQKGVGRWEGHYRVKQSVASHLEFRQINLIEPYHHDRLFEVIFCRNVLIYFDRHTQERLIKRLCRCLAPGGFVITGNSENLHGFKLPLRCLQPSIYQLSD
jgi:chemotaxis protein methyltransferase CheR